MADYDYQCLLCGAIFDGEMVDIHLHMPERCPECGGPEDEIVPIELEEVNDRKENEHDFDYLCP